MSTKTAIYIEDYLKMSFPDLDREYRDGETVERTMPDYPHGKAQGTVVAYFVGLRKELPVFPCVETRMRLSTTRVLIPDVAVFWAQEPGSRIPDQPPLIVIEILSPDDRMQEVRAKLEEYRAWGVPHVWLADPHLRRLYVCDEGLREVTSLPLPELKLELGPTDVFGD